MPPALLNTPLNRWVRVFETSKHEQQSETIVEPPKTIIEVECLRKMNKDFVNLIYNFGYWVTVYCWSQTLDLGEDGSDWTLCYKNEYCICKVTHYFKKWTWYLSCERKKSTEHKNLVMSLSNVIIIRQGHRFLVKHEMWGGEERNSFQSWKNNKQEEIKDFNC